MRGLTTSEIKLKMTRITNGNFYYWIRFRAKIEPIGTKIVGRRVVDIFPEETIEKVQKLMDS